MEAVPPPQAVPVAAEVTNGGLVQIPLRVFGKQEQNTTYIIRKGPQLGKIVSVTPLEAEVSVLAYQHTSAMNGEAKLQDKILFAAQNKNGTSANAEIIVTIVDVPPELAAPNNVDMGDIAAGRPASRIVTISNQGGGLLEGTASVDAPWQLAPSTFKLRRGEKAYFQLTLTPDAEREYQGRLLFVVGETQFQPTVHAKAFAPFTASPGAQTLRITDGMIRTGTVTLSNRTANTLAVQIDANERLQLPAEVSLAPGKTELLPINLGAENTEGIDSTVRFTCGTIFKQVKIAAQRLRVAAATPPPAAAKQATPGSWPSATPAPVSSPAAPAVPTAPASLVAQQPAAGPVPAPENTPKPADASVTVDTGTTQLLIERVTVASLSAKGTVELTWPIPPPKLAEAIANYQVEVRHQRVNEKQKVTPIWVAIPDVLFSARNNHIMAKMAGVPVGNTFTVHIIGLDSNGKPIATSLPVNFMIPKPQPLFTVQRLLLAGFCLLLAGAFVYRWKQTRTAKPAK